jgi:hypothetical protein
MSMFERTVLPPAEDDDVFRAIITELGTIGASELALDIRGTRSPVPEVLAWLRRLEGRPPAYVTAALRSGPQPSRQPTIVSGPFQTTTHGSMSSPRPISKTTSTPRTAWCRIWQLRPAFLRSM